MDHDFEIHHRLFIEFSTKTGLSNVVATTAIMVFIVAFIL